MTTNGKSNTFLLGRIYERTEQNSKILPVIQRDISDMKEKLNKDHYDIQILKRDVKKSVGVFIGNILSAFFRK